MTEETSEREKVIEEAAQIADAVAAEDQARVRNSEVDPGYGTMAVLSAKDIAARIRALASPSPQEPALRGGKVEEIARECVLICLPLVQTDPPRFRLLTKRIAAALRTHAGESAAQSEPVPDASMTNADWLRAISAWVPQHADHLGEAADELNELRAAQSERAGLERAAAIAEKEADDAREQIEHNNEYARRSGSDGSAANEACRKTIYVAEKIAEEIRALSAARKAGGE